MARRRLQQTFKLARTVGDFDEYPAMPDGVDPQIAISRNSRSQPFFLVCEKDTMVVQMSGTGRIEFRDSSVLHVATVPGDFVYVPARTPHRLVSHQESIYYRYKAEKAGLEALCWYCEGCGAELFRHTWDTGICLPQEGYLHATNAFNDNPDLRTCSCGAVHPEADVAGNRWQEIVNELRQDGADDADDW